MDEPLEEDGDDDLYNTTQDEKAIDEFRSRISASFRNSGGASASGKGRLHHRVDQHPFHTGTQHSDQPTEADWAKATTEIRPGTILLANPKFFCDTTNDPDGISNWTPSSDLLARFGFPRSLPNDMEADRLADLLPVVMLVEYDKRQGFRGVLLNHRTGYLLGDLEQTSKKEKLPNIKPGGALPLLHKFSSQPLWLGGIVNRRSGVEMLHCCPTIQNAQPITEDGLYWGGDPVQAQSEIGKPSGPLHRPLTGFDFKFFAQCTVWSQRIELRREIDNKCWFPALASRELLFKTRERTGTQVAKPLWSEIMELMGNEYRRKRDHLYGDS